MVKYVLAMLLYIFAGGMSIGFSIDKWQRKQYIRFGIYLICAIFDIICITELVFQYVIGG